MALSLLQYCFITRSTVPRPAEALHVADNVMITRCSTDYENTRYLLNFGGETIKLVLEQERTGAGTKL
jgi:hypothetical protein